MLASFLNFPSANAYGTRKAKNDPACMICPMSPPEHIEAFPHDVDYHGKCNEPGILRAQSQERDHKHGNVAPRQFPQHFLVGKYAAINTAVSKCWIGKCRPCFEK